MKFIRKLSLNSFKSVQKRMWFIKTLKKVSTRIKIAISFIVFMYRGKMLNFTS